MQQPVYLGEIASSRGIINFMINKIFRNTALFITIVGLSSHVLWAGKISINLNGAWEYGLNRNYDQKVEVPGVADNPAHMAKGVVWYKKKVALPQGTYNHATIELKGARFNSVVYINGQKASYQNGGMAPTYHRISHPDIIPDTTITIEIALQSLKNVSVDNASWIPHNNRWQTNISSYLWDDVLLHLHSDIFLKRIIPFDQKEKVKVAWELGTFNDAALKGLKLMGRIVENGSVLSQQTMRINALKGAIHIPYSDKMGKWSPETPNVYELQLILLQQGGIIDSTNITYGIKNISTNNSGFVLNELPYKIRGGSIDWHSMTREDYAKKIAWDTAWFRKNVIIPLKERGANLLRFRKGTPPERILNLCDKYGLLVQYEWLYSDALPATTESLKKQWKNWLGLAARHPSVALIHPYGEIKDDQLEKAWYVLDELINNYPPMVFKDRDVLHVHNYWWSLFENVGLYYDTAAQFPKPIMVDGFGGNFLDGECNMGGYPALKESYLRFLGRNYTPDSRCEHLTRANAKIAEYWRRIGAAGFSTFTILGSWENGNHWYLGDASKGNLKPVWNGLTAAWSPVSVSMELWDANFKPGEEIKIPVYFFNDTEEKLRLQAEISLHYKGEEDRVIRKKRLFAEVPAFGIIVKSAIVRMPSSVGRYVIKARLSNPPVYIEHPVISSWDVRVLKAHLPEKIQTYSLAIPAYETELRAFAEKWGFPFGEMTNSRVGAVLTSRKTWQKIAQGDTRLLNDLEKAIDNGVPVIMLDIGDIYFGQGYPDYENELGHLQGMRNVEQAVANKVSLFKGLSLSFKEIAEPESHIHPSLTDSCLWKGLDRKCTWLWNGLRGGLIVPATGMEVKGLNKTAFLSKWVGLGADTAQITHNNYYAYQLQGYYMFSNQKNDRTIINKLKDKVKFIVEGTPALANAINPNAPVKEVDLHNAYKDANGEATGFYPLVNAGKNLTKTPVIKIDFGEGKGNLIISQLLTNKRLAPEYSEPGLYGVRYDEAAVQFVFNMIDCATKKSSYDKR